MMRSLLLLAFMAVPAFRADAYFDSGNQLYDRCQRSGEFSQGVCSATISAAYDTMQALGYKCSSDQGVTRGQVRDVVVKYLADNPQDRNAPAVFSIILAMEKGFGCKR